MNIKMSAEETVFSIPGLRLLILSFALERRCTTATPAPCYRTCYDRASYKLLHCILHGTRINLRI